MSQSMKSSKSPFLLRLIAIFKLAKAALLLVVGIWAAFFMEKYHCFSVFDHWNEILQSTSRSNFIHHLLTKIGFLNEDTLKKICAGSFIYFVLLSLEGLGLWFQKEWAEYLTIIVTGSFIPFEVYEIFKKLTPQKIVLLIINVLILIYLILRLIHRKRERPSRPA